MKKSQKKKWNKTSKNPNPKRKLLNNDHDDE